MHHHLMVFPRFNVGVITLPSLLLSTIVLLLRRGLHADDRRLMDGEYVTYKVCNLLPAVFFSIDQDSLNLIFNNRGVVFESCVRSRVDVVVQEVKAKLKLLDVLIAKHDPASVTRWQFIA